jgi:L-threonine kinase
MDDANTELYRDFPPDIREAYKEAVEVIEPFRRHNHVLRLAELALEYMASLAFSDYRSRLTTPSENVESLLEELRTRNLTLGNALQLLQASAGAVSDPLFPKGVPLTARQLPATGRLSAAMLSITAALDDWEPSTNTAKLAVEKCVSRALERTTPKLSWWRAWEEIVNYRNRLSHSRKRAWPITNEHYYDVFTPLFEAAVVEVLAYPPVAAAILDHPLVDVTLMTDNPDGTVTHTVMGEERGVSRGHEVVLPKKVTDIWKDDAWHATSASKYVLECTDGLFDIRALYWDISESPPPPLGSPKFPSAAASAGTSPASRVSRSKRPLEGRGVAPGTCGEFAQGPLPDGEEFHVTCPINKSATVDVEVRAADDFVVTGLQPHQKKLELALRGTAEHLDLGTVAIQVRWWSDLDVGKGMGSSTADVLSGIRALANAVGEKLTPETEGALATHVESSDGTMYPGIAAVNQKTGLALRRWPWYPEFVIVMLVPNDTVLTEAIDFERKKEQAREYETLLGEFDASIESRSIESFAAASTRAVEMNAPFVPNAYANNLTPRLGELGALGMNVGHTGTVCGLLYPNTREGRERASQVSLEVSGWFPSPFLKDVKIVTTPQCPNKGSGSS